MGDTTFDGAVGDEVISLDGANVGIVSDLIREDGAVTFLQVHSSGLFDVDNQHFLVPVEAATLVGNQVQVNRSREDMVGIPAHDGNDPHTQGYFESLFTWWGHDNRE